jgi:hypothetical protein
LRAGVGTFFTQDQPGARRPGRQIDQIGEFGDPGPVARVDLNPVLASTGFPRLVGGRPGGAGQQAQRGGDVEFD